MTLCVLAKIQDKVVKISKGNTGGVIQFALVNIDHSKLWFNFQLINDFQHWATKNGPVSEKAFR